MAGWFTLDLKSGFYYLRNGIEGDDADMAGGISVFFVGVAERSEIF